MTATDLLAHLAGLDMHLLLEDGGLVIDAPAALLTPALRQQIAAHRADLLALLAAESMHGPPTGAGGPQAGPHATVPATDQHQPTDAGLGHPDDERTAPEPPEVLTGRPVPLPANLPAGPLPLWCYDRVHGIEPATPAPDGLTPEQIATEVAAARADWERLVHPVPVRFRPKPQPYRDADLVARILDAGERLHWPALLLRPGERLAAGEACWRRFIATAPLDRLLDATEERQLDAPPADRWPPSWPLEVKS